MEQEIWKDIEGFEKYQISSYGRVKSLRFNKETILKRLKHAHGYYKVSLSKNNISKQFLLHRLVAENFIENPENEPEVNHLNGDKSNNQVTNLQWVTHKQNIHHGWKTGLMENTRKAVKKNVSIAQEARKMPIYSSKLDMKFESINSASRYIQKTYYSNNVNSIVISVTIGKLLLNQIKKSKFDYGWSYINK